MTELLSDNQIQNNLDAVILAAVERNAAAAASQSDRASRYQYVKPFSEASASVLEVLESPQERFTLGLAQIDLLTRGFGSKELIIVNGFSHAGKTQLVNNALVNNRDRRILFFSLDDPAEMILLKLVCMLEDVDAETLEREIRAGEHKAKHALRTAATSTFQNLIVVDDSLSIAAMSQAVEEATDYWGEPPECVVIDYLQSIDGNGDGEDGGVKQKIQSLKRWVKDKPFPTLVIHQNTRSRGGPGAPVTMLSGAYGGEQQATMMIGVWRKRDNEDLDDWERRNHADTITIGVSKNKRPPCRTSEGVDFYLDPKTGRISQLRDDVPQTHTSAESAMSELRQDIDEEPF